MSIEIELIDKLLADYKKPEDILGENGLLKRLTKAIVERAMNAEITEHLGYEKNDPVGIGTGNSHNGSSRKTLKGDFGEVEIEVPRDRNADQTKRADAKALVKLMREATGEPPKMWSRR